MIDLPKGQYEFLVISGDENEDSITSVSFGKGYKSGGEIIKAGAYQCLTIPVIHNEDGILKMAASSCGGYTWKINILIINMYKRLL